MRPTLKVFLASYAVMSFFPRPAAADETPFAYLYTTETLPKATWEYEQWQTVRTGKAAGGYTSFDIDQEIEHGFTDRFQASFYVHSSFLHARDTYNPDDTTANLENQNAFDVNGISVELKYRLLSAEKDPIGLALYAEPELGIRNKLTGEDTVERSVEFKLLVEKHFLDDRLILASNIVFEPEWERKDDTRSKELKNEYLLGASYRFAPHWSGGLEFINRRKFDDQDFSKQSASAFFLGPVLHYAAQRWWASFTVLPQIGGNPRTLGVNANGDAVADSFRTLGEYEKLELRLKIGVYF
jgi:hypothetical protein